MVGAEQRMAEAAQAAEQHLKCKVLQLQPYRGRADISLEADEVDSMEVCMLYPPCGSCESVAAPFL